VNRELGITNWSILTEPAFRQDTGIELETYDDAIMRHVTSRHADTLHPRYWASEDPRAALNRREPIVYLLVHPRHWRAAPVVNARDDLTRLRQTLAYRLPDWRRRSPLRRSP
jgi:hypothetical protein